jgi:predicted CXXCH cytochrome family protein
MRKYEFINTTRIKGGRKMKKISLLLLLVSLALLVAAGTAFAEYEPKDFVHENENFGYFNAEGDRILPENANLSGVYGVGGFAGYDRSVPGQNVHTNFQKNTNSCASCHMTHTAASSALLFRDSVANTCAACHDGSLGRLNVYTPSIQMVHGAKRNNSLIQGTEDEQFPLGQAVSGTFGVDDSITVNGVEIPLNPSTHNVSGSMNMRSAPGGNMHGVRWDGSEDKDADWEAELTCASCHMPHGSHSMRLLHNNPNNISVRSPEYGGLRVVGGALKIMTQRVDGQDVPVTMNRNNVAGFKVAVDGAPNSAWLYTASYSRSGGRVPAFTLSSEIAGSWVNYNEGYIFVPGTAEEVNKQITGITANVMPAVTVREPEIVDGRIVYDAASRTNYDFFCASCHTDYDRNLTGRHEFGTDPGKTGGSSRGDLTGIYSKAHRHTVRANNSYEISGATCVSCHFVHGADSLIKKTADEYVIGIAALDIAAGEYKGIHEHRGNGVFKEYENNEAGQAAFLQDNRDVNPSSALKRYTNMSSCWKCHGDRGGNYSMFENPYWHDMNDAGVFDTWSNDYSEHGIQ